MFQVQGIRVRWLANTVGPVLWPKWASFVGSVQNGSFPRKGALARGYSGFMIDRYGYPFVVVCVVGVKVVDPVGGAILSSLTNWSFPITIHPFRDVTVKN